MKRTLEGIHNLRTVADGAADAWDTAPESHKPILRDCSDALMQAADEIERLRAIVDRLPKTADGVPIYPGMTVWALIPGLEISDAEVQVVGIGGVWRYCYSTREAAEKARKG